MENDLGSLKDEFPDKYLFAEDLGGKPVTVKISAMNSDSLVTAKGKKRAVIVSFEGKKKVLVLNKTNACLINAMFPLAPGASLKTWTGKRITLYPTQCKLGAGIVGCIRVWGSPDIPADRDVVVQQGLKRVAMKVHAVKTTEASAVANAEHAPKPDNVGTMTNFLTGEVQTQTWPETRTVNEPDPALLEAWSALGWSREQGAAHLQEFIDKFPEAHYLNHLGLLIDEENAKEGTV